MYKGLYHGKKHHEADLLAVLGRGVANGVGGLLLTASTLRETTELLQLISSPDFVETGIVAKATVGFHPCSAKGLMNGQSSVASLLDQMRELAGKPGVGALGEMGLDYDRFHYADQETQLAAFTAQLEAVADLDLPMFLHNRASTDDFLRLLRDSPIPSSRLRGVVHSFTGTQEELDQLLTELPPTVHIGVNGCSLKTAENCEVAAAIPLDRLHIETDGPWCGIRPSHAGSSHVTTSWTPADRDKKKWQPGAGVKGRSEPRDIVKVAEVLAGIRKDDSFEEIVEASYRNSREMFFPEIEV
jgi:TatD DNase family protein